MKNKAISADRVNWLVFLVIFLSFMITEFTLMVCSFFSYDKPNVYVLNIAVQILAIFVPTILYVASKQVDFKDFFRIKKIGSADIGIICGLFVTIQFIGTMLNAAVYLLIKLFFELPPSTSEVPATGSQFLYALFVLCLLPAIFEELLLRGVVLRAYEMRGTKNAIILSGFLFALVHLQIINFPSVLITGILLSYVVIQTGSILAGMLGHFVNNLTALVVSVLLSRVSLGSGWIELIMIGVYLLSIGGFMIFLRLFNKRKREPETFKNRSSLAKETLSQVFTLPIILIIITFVLVQLVQLNIITGG